MGPPAAEAKLEPASRRHPPASPCRLRCFPTPWKSSIHTMENRPHPLHAMESIFPRHGWVFARFPRRGNYISTAWNCAATCSTPWKEFFQSMDHHSRLFQPVESLFPWRGKALSGCWLPAAGSDGRRPFVFPSSTQVDAGTRKIRVDRCDILSHLLSQRWPALCGQ